MRTATILLALALCGEALCSERAKMSDNSDQTSLKDKLETLSKAFESENLDAFERCFSESRRPMIRRKYAMVFVEGSCSMDLVEFHAIEIKDETASAAVRYKMSDSHGSSEVVSTVKFVKHEGEWLINGESIVSRKSCSDSASVVSRPVDQQQGERWDPMNPDPSKISPNLKHLIGDVGILPGMGCANGNCANGRCEVR